MPTCPACRVDVPPSAPECPGCHLASGLFDAVREAAGPDGHSDPVFMQTVGELLRSVDLSTPAAVPDGAGPAPLLDRSGSRRRLGAPADRPARQPATLARLDLMPSPPPFEPGPALRRRLDEYVQLARRSGIDLGDAGARLGPAALVQDDAGLESVARELFVRLASALAEQYDRTLARRNELSQLVPTFSADVEFEAVRTALAVGDLAGAARKIEHVEAELSRIEEEWATGRILATECDLLAETLKELGGDPGPAMEALQEGRQHLGAGRREPAERTLARSAIALWELLKPRFTEELKRLRDRLVEARSAGADVGPAVAELRTITVELKARNFVGTIGAYRHLRGLAERLESPVGAPVGAGLADPARPAPSA